MAGEHDEVVSSFLGVTGATDAQARFFLESANWELDAALISFFNAADDGLGESGPFPVEAQNEDEEMSSFPVAPVGRATQGHGRFPENQKPTGKEKKKGSSSRGGGITTLSDLGRRHPDSDEDSDEGPQEYYTGGEKSGMMVQDPTKKGPRDVDAIFDRARRFGAQEGRLAEPPNQPPSSSNNRGAFAGSSRTLNGEPQQQQQPEQQPSPTVSPGGPVFHTITFWRNGFTVDDGPLRRLDDPANESFLDSINKGECPRELEPADRSTQLHVNLVKKDEEWEAPPQPKYVAFAGTGRTLGSGSAPVPGPVPVSGSEAPAAASANQPFQGLVVDEFKPSTSIQLRLSDGTRMVARFNHSHTVADIRGFIDAARPGSVGPYSLQTMGFPPKPLTDMKQSIEAASLVNAVVIQKAL